MRGEKPARARKTWPHRAGRDQHGTRIQVRTCVPDTNILVSAAIWKTSLARKLLREKTLTFYWSRTIQEECKHVLVWKFNHSIPDANEKLQALASFLEDVEPTTIPQIVHDDPDDDHIIACALAGKADYIVTFDKHLLNIREYEGIKIVKPEDLL
ncbi:MAG: putative toxin-antitoxin system toxin component, PIN family [Candidatus Woesearchaeota archaeon]|nr:putative toxin-antitoxin system toxin component, PIN family [Candidatus Woesearchaeota archaeon]